MRFGNLVLPLFCVGVLLTVWYSENITAIHVKPGPIHITYWEKWTGFEADAMRDVVDTYNKSQNRIFVDLLTVSSIERKTLLAIAGNNPPDVAGLYGANVAQYADDNAVLPLDDYCARYGIKEEQYIPVYWSIGYYRGHVYAMPSTPASTALHYNKAMLKAAGIVDEHGEAKPPVTIEEMNADAIKITTKEAGGRLVKAGFLPAEPGWWNWGWGYFFGGSLWDGKDKITANSPENIRGFEWVQSWSKNYGAASLQTFRSGFGNFSSPENAFLSSKVAMELQGVWMSNYISKYSPKLDHPNKERRDEFGWDAVAFPYPSDRPELKDTNFADEDVLVIPRGAKHPDEAADFIAFVQSQKGMEQLCMGQKKHTPLIAVSEAFRKNHPNPRIQLFIDLARSKNVVAPPKMGLWPEYQAEMSTTFDEIALLKKTPKEALDHVQERMQAKMEEYVERLRLRDESEKRSTLTQARSDLNLITPPLSPKSKIENQKLSEGSR